MKCKYSPYGPCQLEAEPGTEYCSEHNDILCDVCNSHATHGCAYCGQFVCGTPLCDNCEGYNVHDKPSGSWGFMNHMHREKENKNGE